MIRPEEYLEMYRILDTVSPVPFDCGTICGASCCHSDEPDDGIYLLPGEEALHDNDEWQSISRSRGFLFVQCKGPDHCHREIRPIQCRTFPLVPTILNDGSIGLCANDMVLAYSCPMLESDVELDRDFIAATEKVWTRLAEDPAIRRLVEMWNE
ncbi:MAG: hypothetical protein IJV04_07580 [Lachnospiraceae bacterium]|nr:hypothetical protein [Lachnospiraceae bacterium]